MKWMKHVALATALTLSAPVGAYADTPADQLIVGPRGLAAGTIECKNRRSGTRQDLPIDGVLARFAGA